MDPPKIEILDLEVDSKGDTPNYYRVLVNEKHFKYIAIDAGIYDSNELCFKPVLLEKLPPFPPGDWNCGRISLSRSTNNPTPIFQDLSRTTLPSIKPLWHPRFYDYLSLKIEDYLMPNVRRVTTPQFEKSVIAKFATWEWEIQYYAAETQAYSWIKDHNIGPEFLGHLTEEGRVIGFLVEDVKGRHATISDLSACKDAVKRLHALGIVHGDLNKYNFLIGEGGDAVLIDFECAKRSGDVGEMERELAELEGMLLDESGKGTTTVMEEDEEN